MATIYKRGKNYAYMVDLPYDADGKRKRISKSGFKTKKAAQRAANELELKINSGLTVTDSSLTIDEIANMWLEEHSKFTKESTFARYKSKTNQIMKQFSGQKITQIHRIDIQRYINELADSYSLSIVSKSKIILKQIFDYACKNDFLSKNP